MKKKTTPYEFKNSKFDIMWDVNIKPRKHDVFSTYDNFLKGDDEQSPDIKKLREFPKFDDELYDFVKNYNEKYKTLKMKKEHQHDGDFRKESLITTCLEVENGVGYVGWFPLLDEHEYEKNMWGDFKIKKTDMMKFINDFSKKIKFQYNPNSIVDEFKRVGNWYSLTIGNTKYNVIIQKSSNSFNCEPSSIIVYDEDNQYISPIRDRKKIYDKIESIMEKVDFKYDVVDEE